MKLWIFLSVFGKICTKFSLTTLFKWSYDMTKSGECMMNCVFPLYAISIEGHEIIGGRFTMYYPCQKKDAKFLQADIQLAIS